MNNQPPTYVLTAALQALEAFSEKHGGDAKLNEHVSVGFTVAWLMGRSFEWTPNEEQFARIIAVNPAEQEGKVALVFRSKGYSYEYSPELTEELNKLIREYTRDRWN